jgi:hypothetical protein
MCIPPPHTQVDAAGRNLALSYLNNSIAHAAALIRGFGMLAPEGLASSVKTHLQPDAV